MNGRTVKLENIFVILSEPKGPANVGAAARAMNNMGLRELALVNPCDHTCEEARKMASGCNDTLLGAKVFGSAREATADAGFVVGATCRSRKGMQNFIDFETLSDTVSTASQKNRVALLFGTERTGLTNEETALCHALVTIPTSSLNLSLNLSQAVLLVCFEIFRSQKKPPAISKIEEKELASSGETEQMYEQMEELLTRIGYVNPENPNHIMMAVRSIFARASLDSRDVRILRGIFGKIDCYRKWIEKRAGQAGS